MSYLCKSSLLKTLQERGFLYQATDLESLDALCQTRSITAYIGFDATANSLHVGNLLGLMMARWLQETGHTPLLLMGGGTTKIGDPSGRNTQRQMLSDVTINANIEGLKRDAGRIVSFEEGRATLVNNDDWLNTLLYIPFLREIGVHFSMNRMLSFEMVRSRLDQDQPLSFIEFNYMVLQAYDFLELFKKYECVLQLGGSDQWGNIVCGVDLVRRITGQSVYGLTCPLLTTATGAKMGKSAEGAIWLDPNQLSPYAYWQFWRNTHDSDVERFLKLYTLLPMEDIQALSQWTGKEINEAKKILADEATKLLHGAEVLPDIHRTASGLFGGATSDIALHQLPQYTVSEQQIVAGDVTILAVLEGLSLIPSRREGRQKIREGAVRLGTTTVVQEEIYCLKLADFESPELLVSVGHKKHGVVRLT